MPGRNKDTEIGRKILIALGGENKRVNQRKGKAKHGQLYWHPVKKWTIQFASTPGDVNSIKQFHRSIIKIAKEFYTYDELKILLKDFIKKGRIILTVGPRIEIGAFYAKMGNQNDNRILNSQYVFLNELEKLLKPPQKKIQATNSEDNHKNLKKFASMHNRTVGDVIELLMERNSTLFENLPDDDFVN